MFNVPLSYANRLLPFLWGIFAAQCIITTLYDENSKAGREKFILKSNGSCKK